MAPKHSEEFSMKLCNVERGNEAREVASAVVAANVFHQAEIMPYESWVTGFAIDNGQIVNIYNASGTFRDFMSHERFYDEYPIMR